MLLWKQTCAQQQKNGVLNVVCAGVIMKTVELSAESQPVKRTAGGWCEMAASLKPS
jgi:hypothetical protein